MTNFDKQFKQILEDELIQAAHLNDLNYLFDLLYMIAEINEGEKNEE